MKTNRISNPIIASLVLVAFTGCNLSLDANGKRTYLDSNVKTVVSKVIDEQMTYVKPNLEPELQSEIDNGVKDGSPMTGSQIVSLTTEEEHGTDYIDFCYDVQSSTISISTDDVMDSARAVLPDEEYQKLQEQVESATKALQDWGDTQIKGLPAEQQEDFYKDLKVLVTRTVVLLTAGIVYALMPDVVFWGKVSAAAAVSVGAGLVALASMTLYQKYKFQDSTVGPQENQSIEDWLKSLVEEPKADYALTTAVVSLATTFGQGSVVTGIMICVFGVLQAWDLISAMLKKYDFSV